MRIIQFGVDSSSPREFLSKQQIKNLGYFYTRIENPTYDHEPPLDKIFKNNKDLYIGLTKNYEDFGLTPRHYGCWLGHRQAISLGFCEGGHFLVCEGDAKILDVDLFNKRLEEATTLLDNTTYPLVSFSEPNWRTTTQFFDKVSDNLWEYDNIINAHCYLVNGNSKHIFDWLYKNIGWHAFDWWLNYAIADYIQTHPDEKCRQLCFKEKITMQHDGYSEIDKIIKNY